MIRERKTYVAFSCHLLLVGLSRSRAESEDESQQVEDVDEYAVLSSVLTQKYQQEGKSFVIAVETSSTKKSTFKGYRTGWVGSGAKRPDVDPTAASDFDTRNGETYVLKDAFALKIPYSLVNEADLLKIFVKDQEGKIDM